MGASQHRELKFAMVLSFCTSLFLLVLKSYAYYITDSTAILSDAAESVIHVFAVGFALYSLNISLKPADENHPYGHDKVNFFSAGFEGAMIIIAALYITYEALYKLYTGVIIHQVLSGIGFLALATAINAVLGCFLVREGRLRKSLILEANGKHTLTDCWTSLAVIAGLLVVKWTNIALFDPLIALAAALNIVWTGYGLVRNSVHGLMDHADPEMHKELQTLIENETKRYGVEFHRLRHRHSGYRTFVEFHLLFPKAVTLQQAHETASKIECSLKKVFGDHVEVTTHLEPKEGHDRIHRQYGLEV